MAAAAAGQPRFRTIYDVIVAGQPKLYEGLYAGTHAIADYPLYDEVSRLLGIFALADLRHDFGRGADIFIVSAKKTIGQLFCDYVAAAFYKPASARYIDLQKYLRDSYDERITSNNTAIKFFKSVMDDFFLNRMANYRQLFAIDAYVRYYDSCAAETMDYDTLVKLNHILTVISPADDRANQRILVDAMMGNPMEKIFSGAPGVAKPNYLYNFASVMDAAPKASGNAHTYMKTYVQVPKTTLSDIHPAYTSFGARTDIVGFEQAEGIWQTTAQVTAADGAAVRETFSVFHKASVNNMGLMLVRGKGAAGGAPGKVAGQVNVFEEILVPHLFKSLGDRLQCLSVSVAGLPLIHYNQVKDIYSGVKIGVAQGPATENTLVFTNDEMNNYQLYMMRVNSVYTGFGTVTPYKNRETTPLKVDDVQKYFFDRAASMHEALKALPEPQLIVNTRDTIRATLHEALTRQRVLEKIAGNPLLAILKEKKPTAAEINEIVTGETFRFYTNLMTDAIVDYLRQSAVPEMSAKFIKVTLAKYYDEAAKLNSDAITDRLQGVAFNDLYLRWFVIVTGLTEFFKTIGLSPVYAQLVANGLLSLYRNIRNNLYVNNKLIDKLSEGVDKAIVTQKIKGSDIATALAEYQVFINAKIEGNEAVAAASDKYLSIMCLQIVIRAVTSDKYEQLMKIVFAPINVVVIPKAASNDATAKAMGAALVAALPPEEAVVPPGEDAVAPPPPKASALNPKRITMKPSQRTRKIKGIRNEDIQQFVQREEALSEQKALRNSRAKNRVLRAAYIKPVRAKAKRTAPKLTFGDFHPRAAHISAIYRQPDIDGEIEAYSHVGSYEPLGFFWRPVNAIKEAYDAFTRYIGSMGGGGTRTRERESKLAHLCILKLNCMALNIQKSPVYAADLLAGSDLITTIMEDMKAISSSKSRPVLLRSSLSRIEEEGEEEGTQTGGGGTQTQLLTMVEPPKPQTYRVLHLKASKPAPDMTLASGTKVKILSGPQAKSLLEQRLAAFLWLGFNRSRETLRLEAEVSASLIGIDEFTADAHYDLFWAYLFDFTDKSYEYFAQKFEKGITTHFAGQSRSPLKRVLSKLKRNTIRAAHASRFYAKPA